MLNVNLIIISYYLFTSLFTALIYRFHVFNDKAEKKPKSFRETIMQISVDESSRNFPTTSRNISHML